MKNVMSTNGEWVTYYDIDEVAHRLHMTPFDVWRDIAASKLTCDSINGCQMVSETNLQAYWLLYSNVYNGRI